MTPIGGWRSEIHWEANFLQYWQEPQARKPRMVPPHTMPLFKKIYKKNGEYAYRYYQLTGTPEVMKAKIYALN